MEVRLMLYCFWMVVQNLHGKLLSVLLTAEFCCVAWDYACNKKNVVLTEGTS